jgi:hypothetical protein
VCDCDIVTAGKSTHTRDEQLPGTLTGVLLKNIADGATRFQGCYADDTGRTASCNIRPDVVSRPIEAPHPIAPVDDD